MIVHLDTSFLVDALTARGTAGTALRHALLDRHRLCLSSIVLYEWLRGPRPDEELRFQEALFPSAETIAFGAREALTAARLYRAVKRPRGREIDLAIAACAIEHGAALWTLNEADFADVPGLRLFSP
jgi:predicted nucleic acid-binding protein